jgi:CRP-like cAMP-binding protein
MKASDIISLITVNNLVEKTITVERNELLKHEFTVDTDIYFIKEGSLRVFVYDGDDERNVRFGYENNLLVSLDSFLTEKPSEFIIQAIKKSIVHIIPKQRFLQFIEQDELHLKLWIGIMEDLVLQQIEREKDLLISSPKERFERVLKRSPQLFQEIPHRHIANYLRMTPETLSRLKKS